MSANSCNNFLNRDPEFTAGFLARHQDKLIFGCDCSCSDGRGGGVTNPNPRLHGKCIARETLAAAQRMSKPEAFSKIRWENGTRLRAFRPRLSPGNGGHAATCRVFPHRPERG